MPSGRQGRCGAETAGSLYQRDRAMRNTTLALVGAIVIIAQWQGLESVVWAGVEDDERTASVGFRGSHRPWHGTFDVQVRVGGRPVAQQIASGERRVEAVAGAEY